MNSVTRFCRADEHDHAQHRRQQQRVVLAVAGLARRHGAPRRAGRPRRAAATKMKVSASVRSSIAIAPAMTLTLSPHCQIAEADRRAERRRASAAARPSGARSATRSRPTSSTMHAPPVSASSGEIAIQSMCGPTAAAASITASPPDLRGLAGIARHADRGCARRARELLQRLLRIEREGEDRRPPAARARAPSRTLRSNERDFSPDAVVHRADEHPQHVDRRQRDAGEGDDRDRRASP